VIESFETLGRINRVQKTEFCKGKEKSAEVKGGKAKMRLKKGKKNAHVILA
jgi:hypothetical protein